MVVTSIRSMEHRADIQGLRAVAVLLVIADHAGARLAPAGGFVGVDVFFVISGFLITGTADQRGSAAAERCASASSTLAASRRILPAATAGPGSPSVAYAVSCCCP